MAANVNKKLEPVWEQLDSSCGDLFTLKDFKDSVESGGFIDYDGFGSLSNGKQIAKNFTVKPSWFKKDKVHFGNIFLDKRMKLVDIPNWATHVVWYNR